MTFIFISNWIFPYFLINKLIFICNYQVQQYKQGNKNLFSWFVGQVMKETKGNANPKLVNDILTKYLN